MVKTHPSSDYERLVRIRRYLAVTTRLVDDAIAALEMPSTGTTRVRSLEILELSSGDWKARVNDQALTMPPLLGLLLLALGSTDGAAGPGDIVPHKTRERLVAIVARQWAGGWGDRRFGQALTRLRAVLQFHVDGAHLIDRGRDGYRLLVSPAIGRQFDAVLDARRR